ncbi:MULTISPECIES: hypothetical protein [unclassified Streptomyces]|uniref:hypothetical protein n=1 Tax=unclassified Streptomyces TaxID=2593676 RepID=UPI0004C001C1|nr:MULTISPECIES: hypothetical protein [unclassified Streptomyces]
MAMVGLFWIVEGDVYVGAKPSGPGPGVRLTPEGVTALGDGREDLLPWADVTSLTVSDVPVRTLPRRIGAAVGLALQTVREMALPNGHGRVAEAPGLMTVRVTTAGGAHALEAYVAAAGGYPATEADLSRALLARLADGSGATATTLAAMARWGRAAADGTPRGGERERLLREWLG